MHKAKTFIEFRMRQFKKNENLEERREWIIAWSM